MYILHNLVWCSYFFSLKTIFLSKSTFTCILNPHTVPSEPLNLRYMNNSAISITVFWDPPAERNGVLQNYTLMYEEFGTERMVFIDIPPGNESDGFVVEPLMEYHMYSVSVAASTDKGFGPYSRPLEVLTDEHGMDYIIEYLDFVYTLCVIKWVYQLVTYLIHVPTMPADHAYRVKHSHAQRREGSLNVIYTFTFQHPMHLKTLQSLSLTPLLFVRCGNIHWTQMVLSDAFH